MQRTCVQGNIQRLENCDYYSLCNMRQLYVHRAKNCYWLKIYVRVKTVHRSSRHQSFHLSVYCEQIGQYKKSFGLIFSEIAFYTK